ncbi:MAG: HAD-IA family hydrolase [Gammaproteobacteria bacterium]|jgi:putative hydrolase of the HAD superfamily|nr:HAD-IA family hydrolase [Gammaproteobacteria bacterium]
MVLSVVDASKLIKAITFDLDGTLWALEPVIAEADRKLHEWFALHYPAISSAFSIYDMQQLRTELLEWDPTLRHDVTELRKSSIRIAAERVSIDPTVAEEAFEVFIVYRNQVELFDDVLPVLKRLRNQYMLCSLTNGNADVVRVGLGDIFDHALTAADVGSAKPEPAMFMEACRLTGNTPEQMLHVGDEAETDIFGANTAGFRTIWINRKKETWNHECQPHAQIESLTELETVLATWNTDD